MASSSRLPHTSLPSLETLAQWCDSNGLSRHPDVSVSPMQDGSGWKVQAEDDIAVGSVLCSVPKHLIISHRTSAYQAISPWVGEEGSSQIQLHLAACLLHEIRLGRASNWRGYLQAIPGDAIIIPTFWSEEGLAGPRGDEALPWLQGTQGEKELERKNAEGLSIDDLQTYFETAPFPSTAHAADSAIFHDFLYAYSLVSSRGFAIDAYHQVGIIPFCDFFNHSAHSHTSLLSDACVCPECGSLPICPHDPPDTERLDHLSEGYLEKLESEGSANSVDMRAEREIKAGEEVFSRYEDDLGDGKLLVEWGFLGREGAGHGVSWSPRDILDQDTAPIFMALLQAESLERAISEMARGSQDLLATSLSPPRFTLRTDSRLSPALFLGVLLRVLDPLPTSLGEAESQVLDILRTIASGAIPVENTLCREVVDTFIRLLGAKLDQYHRPELSLEEVKALLQDVDETDLALRQALLLSLDERTLVLSIKSKWQKLNST